MIVGEVNEIGVDLIVFGMYGWCGLKYLVFGSVVEGVVCKINKLVLMVCSEVEE